MNTPLWHTFTKKDSLLYFESSEEGLSSEGALRRRAEYGENVLPKEKAHKWWGVLMSQFTSPMIIVLLVAAGISLVLGERLDAGVIAAAILVNTIIGFVQEYKASKALEHLQNLVQPKAIILRDQKEIEVYATEIVPGDILVLHAGDRVTADVRLITGTELLVNEAALTGESFPVKKSSGKVSMNSALAERKNMLYAGTSVVGGRGRAVVVATGVYTELGKIAQLVQDTQEIHTPLQDQLRRLSRWISGIVVGLVSALFVLGIVSGSSVVEMFEMSVALAVAAIPEGLIVSVTIILAIGMQRILRRKSLVRRLVGAETLGSVSIICSDKTGTITQGEMRVTYLVTPKQTWRYPFPIDEEPQLAMKKMFHIMALCNDAVYVPSENKEDGQFRGSPTERALLSAVVEQDSDLSTLSYEFPRTAEISFDSAYKYMVTAHKTGKHTEVNLKGAPGIVLSFCEWVQVHGRKVKMSPVLLKEFKEQELEMTKKGIRVIAVATKIDQSAEVVLARETLGGFVFTGFVGLHDPLRENAKEQIEAAKQAGIRTIMITGDHKETARAIGAEAGLVASEEGVVSGRELDEWSDEEFKKRVASISIYARVEPRHKIRVIHAWQERGDVVAMVGDGVNDAPAIKAADVGVAVGSGTEVAKQASDIVILDNNLGTITAAIEEGRVIFDNIRKTTVYLLADSFTEMILIGGSILMGLPIPLLPVQILWINLVADSFPNVGLTLEPAEKDVMKLPPRPRSEPVLNREMLTIIFIIGAVTDVILFILYIFLLKYIPDIGEVRSIMFAAVGIDSLLYIFAVKSFRRTIFRINPFSNMWLILGVGIGFALMVLALVHPFFQMVFEITPLHLYGWGLLLIIGVIKLIGIEITKDVFLLRKK